MAGFAFRFERVLKVRETREKDAQRALAAAHLRAQRAQEAVDALNQRLMERESKARKLAQEGAVEPWRLELYADSIQHLKGELYLAQQELDGCLRDVDERRTELVEAMKERKILEALKEKERRSFLIEEARREQSLMDEVAERTTERRRRTAADA